MSPVTLLGSRKGRAEFREHPLPQAHFLERQLVHPKISWEQGSELLATYCAPGTAWSNALELDLLSATHTSGQCPPGNGPFYLPEWSLVESGAEDTSEVYREMVARLTRLGFRSVVTHVIVLSETNDYLVDAMRAARNIPWNVDPTLYRCYLYPTMGPRSGQRLRSYTTQRWIPLWNSARQDVST